jgi:hypothetical protein
MFHDSFDDRLGARTYPGLCLVYLSASLSCSGAGQAPQDGRGFDASVPRNPSYLPAAGRRRESVQTLHRGGIQERLPTAFSAPVALGPRLSSGERVSLPRE